MTVGRDPLAHPEPLLRRVYAYIAYRVGDRTEAEDLTSETFERASALPQQLRRSPRRPGRLAARHRPQLHLRREAPRTADCGRARNGASPRSRAFEAQVVERVVLAQALATLVDRDRELLALRYGADLPPREIASLLEQRTNAVEVALSSARRSARGRDRARRAARGDGRRRSAGRLRRSGGVRIRPSLPVLPVRTCDAHALETRQRHESDRGDAPREPPRASSRVHRRCCSPGWPCGAGRGCGRGRSRRAPSAAVAVTIFALVGATIAAGGPVDASHGLVGFVNVGKHFKGVKDDEEHNWGDPGWPGNWENSIPICHKQEGGWVLLHLVPKTAFVDFFGSKHDFIAGPNWPCPPFR